MDRTGVVGLCSWFRARPSPVPSVCLPSLSNLPRSPTPRCFGVRRRRPSRFGSPGSNARVRPWLATITRASISTSRGQDPRRRSGMRSASSSAPFSRMVSSPQIRQTRASRGGKRTLKGSTCATRVGAIAREALDFDAIRVGRPRGRSGLPRDSMCDSHARPTEPLRGGASRCGAQLAFSAGKAELDRRATYRSTFTRTRF